MTIQTPLVATLVIALAGCIFSKEIDDDDDDWGDGSDWDGSAGESLSDMGESVDVGDDTASPSDAPEDDTGSSVAEGYPPVIENVIASWAEDQNDEWYIEVSIVYSDRDDDVREGGMVGVTLVVDDETFATEWLAIDGFSAIHEGDTNEIRFNPKPPNVTDPAAVFVQALVALKDAQNNRSAEYPITPE